MGNLSQLGKKEECWLLGIGENKQKGDNEGGLLKTLPSQQSRV
jgi:hypothetical protein